MFRSTDQGNTWTPSNPGLPSFGVRSFSVYGAQIFVVTNSGVYHSIDVGLNWVPMNDGLPITVVNSTMIVGMELIIGTENGIWWLPISEFPVGDAQDLTVSMFSTYPAPLHSPCCGQPMTYIVRYGNKGTMPVSDASLRFQLSPHTSYPSYTSTPTLLSPVSTGTNTKTWDIPGTLQQGESGVIHVTALVTCSPPSAPMLVAHARVNPLPGNDTPKDKTAIPAGCAPPGFITANDSLIYTIRFQNLGAGNAHQVIARDTLEADLVLSTIRNKAEIYFDLNEPVITNTVLHTITTSTAMNPTGIRYVGAELNIASLQVFQGEC